MIAGSQCRAGRALVEISRAKLAARANVPEQVIERFENRLGEPDEATIARLAHALEELGAVFIDENGGGIGVRLRFSSSEARQISRMEGEGGVAANDVVP